MRAWIKVANPLAQLSVGLFALAGSYAIHDVSTGVMALSVYAAAVLIFAPGWRYPLVCLLFTSIAAATIFYSTWRLGGHDEAEALSAGLRILVLAWPGSVAIGYVDPARLGDFLAQSLRLPARFVAAFSAALQRFSDYGRAWTQIERARRVRGAGPSMNPVSWIMHAGSMSFAMLVHALRGASQTSIAMDARGFVDAHDRTWAEPATWTRLDVGVVALAFVLGAVAPIAALTIGR
jgi:energy-coupling factor transporter transmembrane protein EcfT